LVEELHPESGLRKRETKIIAKYDSYKNGFNRAEDGEISALHRIVSPETRKKIGLASRGRTFTPKQKAKISAASKRTWNQATDEWKAQRNSKMSKSLTGKIRRQEHAYKIAESRRNNGTVQHTDATKLKMSRSHRAMGFTEGQKLGFANSRKNFPLGFWHGKKLSEEHKQNIRDKSNIGNHSRWHTERGVINSNCQYCLVVL
jgi:hypothetical protein